MEAIQEITWHDAVEWYEFSSLFSNAGVLLYQLPRIQQGLRYNTRRTTWKHFVHTPFLKRYLCICVTVFLDKITETIEAMIKNVDLIE